MTACVMNQLVEVDLDNKSNRIMQHSCYYLLAALDERYLLHKIGSSLLKLSDCLGVINGYLIYVYRVTFQIMTLLGCVQQR